MEKSTLNINNRIINNIDNDFDNYDADNDAENDYCSQSRILLSDPI